MTYKKTNPRHPTRRPRASRETPADVDGEHARDGGVRASARRRSVVFARVSRVFTDDDGVVIVVVIDREGRRETRARRSVARVGDDPAREAR
jgi:hypothetical protein|tara:strand:+ start:207 stop:482 length:276 start_codon:yes stop_codon:yes gene_type:complete